MATQARRRRASRPCPCPWRGGRCPPRTDVARIVDLDSQPGRTPLLAVDLEVVLARYRQVRRDGAGAWPVLRDQGEPAPGGPRPLRAVGLGGSTSSSLPEVRGCLVAGAGPEALSFGNTVKKQRRRRRGPPTPPRRFAFDSATELAKLVVEAPVPPPSAASPGTAGARRGPCPGASSGARPTAPWACSWRRRGTG